MSAPTSLGRRTCASIAAVLALAACSEITESPTAPSQVPFVLPVQMSVNGPAAAGGGFLQNGVPYRNPDYKLATGRSGEAALTVRALMNQDGSTDLQATTGDFVGTEPPFDFSKLQVKYLDEAGEDAVWTENYRRLAGGFVELTFQGIERHRTLQVQGNVTVPNASGKGKRTGVVTLHERVNLRPDVAVLGISSVPQAFVDTEVGFTAAIAELNGDLSATGDCVFYVDGDEAARSDGIFVGEGDQVSCQMDHTFTETGTYEVTASVEYVDPGDFDLGNNQATVTIEIVDPVVQLHGSASAADRHWRYYYNYPSYYREDTRHWTEASFYGSGTSALAFPTSVSVHQSSGGALRSNVDLASFGTAGAVCQQYVDPTTNVRVCSDGANDRTTVNVSYSSGVARYYARNLVQRSRTRWYWHCHFLSCHSHSYTEYYYVWVTTDNRTQPWGNGYQPLGSDYTFDVTLVDDDGTIFRSDPVTFPLDGSYNTTNGNYTSWGRTGYTPF